MSQAKAFQQSGKNQYNDNSRTKMNADTDFNPAFNGAAIIDEEGNEVPITEDMIQSACEELGSEWLFPRQESEH